MSWDINLPNKLCTCQGPCLQPPRGPPSKNHRSPLHFQPRLRWLQTHVCKHRWVVPTLGLRRMRCQTHDALSSAWAPAASAPTTLRCLLPPNTTACLTAQCSGTGAAGRANSCRLTYILLLVQCLPPSKAALPPAAASATAPATWRCGTWMQRPRLLPPEAMASATQSNGTGANHQLRLWPTPFPAVGNDSLCRLYWCFLLLRAMVLASGVTRRTDSCCKAHCLLATPHNGSSGATVPAVGTNVAQANHHLPHGGGLCGPQRLLPPAQWLSITHRATVPDTENCTSCHAAPVRGRRGVEHRRCSGFCRK